MTAQTKESGFTLVELLVVISIIAILAIIGVSVYAGAQGSARDGQRRSELDSITKSIESSKDFSAGIYTYDLATSNADFPKGFPIDPKGASRGYCISSSTTTTPPAVPTSATAQTCSGLGSGFKDLTTSISTTTTNNLGASVPDVKAWTICSHLERPAAPYCVSSLTD